jgi:hypothetical protein
LNMAKGITPGNDNNNNVVYIDQFLKGKAGVWENVEFQWGTAVVNKTLGKVKLIFLKPDAQMLEVEHLNVRVDEDGITFGKPIITGKPVYIFGNGLNPLSRIGQVVGELKRDKEYGELEILRGFMGEEQCYSLADALRDMILPSGKINKRRLHLHRRLVDFK